MFAPNEAAGRLLRHDGGSTAGIHSNQPAVTKAVRPDRTQDELSNVRGSCIREDNFMYVWFISDVCQSPKKWSPEA